MDRTRGIPCLILVGLARIGTVLGAIALAATPNGGVGAQAAPSYPFCGVYVNRSGTPGCYFATREQCMADVSGIGGSCIENPNYRAPVPRTNSRPPARRH